MVRFVLAGGLSLAWAVEDSAHRYSLLNPDPKVLKWDDGQQDHYGNVVYAGWLSVPLVQDEYLEAYETSPHVCLRVKAIAAKATVNGSAKEGPMLNHCGGPGSTADCISMAGGIFDLFDEDVPFDLWSISQRGMEQEGDGSCPFHQPTGKKGEEGEPVRVFPYVQCAELTKILKEHGEGAREMILSRLVPKAEYPSDEVWNDVILPIIEDGGVYGLDFHDETFVRWYYRLMGLNHNLCYQDPQYKVTSASSGREFHLLEYTGTTDLAYDIEVFRKAIGAETMSVRGWSYGTQVAATYLTMFPGHVHRAILDGNTETFADLNLVIARTVDSVENVWEGLASACDTSLMQAKFGEESLACPAAPNVASKAKDLIFGGANYDIAAGVYNLIYGTLLEDDVPGAPELMACIEAFYSNSSVRGCPYSMEDAKKTKGKRLRSKAKDMSGSSEIAIVIGHDQPGRMTEEQMIAWWRTAKDLYPFGITWGVDYAVMISTWPAIPKPNPPIGSSAVRPLVIGNLYDGKTTYRNAEDMVSVFPQGSIMTWQGYGHCLADVSSAELRWVRRRYEEETAAGETPTYTNVVAKILCNKVVFDYLVGGKLPPSGHVCVAASPAEVAFAPNQAFTEEGCACQKEWYDPEFGTSCDDYCCESDDVAQGAWCFTKGDCDSNWGICQDPNQRYTEDGCACKKTWRDSEYDTTCNDYCCESDDVSGGPWCFTKGECRSNWGMCTNSSSIAKLSAAAVVV